MNEHEILVKYLNETYYGGKMEDKIREKLLSDSTAFNKSLELIHKDNYSDLDFEEFRSKYVGKYGDPFETKELPPEATDEFGRPLPISMEKVVEDKESNPLMSFGKRLLQTVGYDLPANTIAANATVAQAPEDLSRIGEFNPQIHSRLNFGEILGKKANQEERDLLEGIARVEKGVSNRLKEITSKYSPNENNQLPPNEYKKYLAEVTPIIEESEKQLQTAWDRIDFIRSQRNEGVIPDGVREGFFRDLKTSLIGGAIEHQEAGQDVASDVIQTTDQIKSPLDFINWAAGSIGQMTGQIPASVATLGTSSIANQIGSIYIDQIQTTAKELGITVEEVLQRDLDNPAKAIAYGIVTAAPDILSAGNIMSQISKNVSKKQLRSFISGLGDNIIESGTEGVQTGLEQFGAGREFDIKEVGEAMASALVGSGGMTAVSSVVGKVAGKKKTIEETISEDIDEVTSSGDVTSESEIDALVEKVVSDIDAVLETDKKKTVDKVTKALEESSTTEEFIQKTAELLPKTSKETTPEVSTEPTTVKKETPKKEVKDERSESKKTKSRRNNTSSVQSKEVKPTKKDKMDKTFNEVLDKKTEKKEVDPFDTTGMEIPKRGRKKGVKNKPKVVNEKGKIPVSKSDKAESIDNKKEEAKVQTRTEKKSSKVNTTQELTPEQFEQRKSKLDKQLSNIAKDPKPGSKTKRLNSFINDPKKQEFTEQIEAAKQQLADLEQAKAEKVEVRQLKSKRNSEEAKLERERIKQEATAKKEAKKQRDELNRKRDTVKAQIVAARLGGKDDSKLIEDYQKWREENTSKGRLSTKELEDSFNKPAIQEAAEEIVKSERKKDKVSNNQNRRLTKLWTPEAKKQVFDKAYLIAADAKKSPKDKVKELKALITDDMDEEVQSELESAISTLSVKKKGKKTKPVAAKLEKVAKKAEKEVEKKERTTTDEGIDFDAEPSPEQIAELEKGLSTMLGFDEDFTEFNFYSNTIKEKEAVFVQTGILQIKETTREAFESTISPENQTVKRIATAILDKVQEIRKKNNLEPLRFYEGEALFGKEDDEASLGVHVYDTKSKKAAIILNKDRANSTTGLHELIHDYTALLADIVHSNNVSKEFNTVVSSVFNEAKDKGNKLLTSIAVKEATGEELTNVEQSFKLAIDGAFKNVDYTNISMDDLYGFKNIDEMLAEAFSNPKFMYVLSSIPSSRDLTKRGDGKLLTDLYKAFIDTIKKFFGDIYPTYKTQLDDLLEVVSNFENEYLDSDYLLSTAEGSALAIKAQELSEGTRQSILSKIAVSIDVNDKLTNTKEIRAFIEKVNKKLSSEHQLDEKDIQSIVGRVKRRRKRFEAIKEIHQAAIDHFKDNVRYKESEIYRSYVDDFLDIDPNKLSNSARATYLNGLRELTTTGEYSHRVANFVKDQVTERRISEITSDKNFKFDQIRNKWGSMNAAQIVTFMSKFSTEHANKLMNTFYSGVMRANANAQLAVEKYLRGEGKGDSLLEIAQKHNLNAKDKAKAYIFAKVQTSDTSLDPESKEFKDHIKARLNEERIAVENKLIAQQEGLYKKQSVSDIKKELEAVRELQKDFKISNGQQALVDRFKEIVGIYEPDIATVTRSVRGKKFTQLYNYVPTFALGKKGDSKFHAPEDRFIDLLEESESDAAYEKIGTHQSEFTLDRTNPKNVYYENDLLSVANKYLRSVSFDAYATKEIKILNKLLNNKKLKEHIGITNRDTINKSLISAIRSAVKKGDDYHPAFRLMEKLKNMMVVGKMGTSGQFAIQLISAIPSIVTYSPSGVIKATKAMFAYQNNDASLKTLKDFMEKHGLGIQVRDVLFEKFESVESFNSSGLKKAASKLGAVSDQTTTGVLRWSDKQAARYAWLAAFFEAGGDLNNPTKEAIAAAERKSILSQNVSDVAFAPSLFKQDNQFGRLLISHFMAFKSFALNQNLNTFYALKNVHKSGEARKILAANMLNSFMYQTVSRAIVAPLYEKLGEILTGEEIEEDEKEIGFWEGVIANTMLDMFIGGMPSLVSEFVYLLYNKTVAKDIHGDGVNEPFDKYDQSPVYSANTVKEIGTRGGYEDMITLTFETSEMAYNLMAGKEFEDGKEEKFYTTILIDLMRTIKLMPFRGDFAKITDKMIKAVRDDQESKSNGTGFASPRLKSRSKPRPRPIPRPRPKPIN